MLDRSNDRQRSGTLKRSGQIVGDSTEYLAGQEDHYYNSLSKTGEMRAELNGDACRNVGMNCFNPTKLIVAIPGKMADVAFKGKSFVNKNTKEWGNCRWCNFHTIQQCQVG